MQIKHNTSLLEEAVAHVVRQASIPSLKAEADAWEKRQRATGFRRLATGLAVAVAAVGIGWGISLALLRPPEPTPQVPRPIAEEAVVTLRKVPASPVEPKVEPQVAAVVPAKQVPIESSTPVPEPVITTDYSKFNTITLPKFGKSWDIKAGHHFDSDTDTEWSAAWCYTNPTVDGVTISVDLAERPKPDD